jgi:hypothetical protein
MYWDPENKILNTFLHLQFREFRIFMSRNYTKTFQRAEFFFLSETGQYGYKNVQNCMRNSDLKKYLRESAPTKIYFYGFFIFEKHFFGIIFFRCSFLELPF